MEWGPRSLGNRSILADPRNNQMQKKLNISIKYREGFRPFAPAVLDEDLNKYFVNSPFCSYMLFTAPVSPRYRKQLPSDFSSLNITEQLYFDRSLLPAITHVDFSARVQVVTKKFNERFWHLLKAFKRATGCGMLVNTSFNVRDEPIVCTPQDALNCFFNTQIDYLVLGNRVISKIDSQRHFVENFLCEAPNATLPKAAI